MSTNVDIYISYNNYIIKKYMLFL